MVFGRTTEPYVVEAGGGCDHVPSQLLRYRSPGYDEHRVWSCPRCRRVVRHDTPDDGREWTALEVQVPVGLEGVALPGGGRGWKMPDADLKRMPDADTKKRGRFR